MKHFNVKIFSLAAFFVASSSGLAQSHFGYTSNTGNNATVAVPTSANPNINGSPLAAGDEIGVFTPAGLCVGAAVWNGSNTAITVWGDNDQTPSTDGIRSGEQMYYRVWRQANNTEYPNVSVSYAVGNGSYSPNGTYVLSSLNATAPPDVPTLASPADGTSGVSSSPTLSWNSASAATSYRLQISTSSTFAQTVLDQSNITGTSFAASGLASGTTHYWRVSAVNDAGSSSFSPAWSFTTIIASPLPPVLSSPADGAVNQPTALTLIWNASAGADSYRLQVSTSATFSSTIVDDPTLTGTSYNVGSLSNGTTYYWRVSATNSGGTSSFSTTRSFTTVPSPPNVPTLSSPPDQSGNQPVTPTLSWNAASGATAYQLQVSKDPSFSAPVVDDPTLTGTSRQIGALENNTTYHWRVRASNTGGTSLYSSTWQFTTIAPPPPPPALLSPTNGAGDLPTTLTLAWNTSSGADTYRVQVSTTSSFSTTVDDATTTGTSRQVGSLANGTRYYWRVMATGSTGSSDWSSVWSFTTVVATPGVPTLASPLNNATDQPTTLTLIWNALEGANSYRLQLSTTASFETVVVDDQTLRVTSKQVGPLANSTTYYWRVNASNTGGASPWSSTWSFTTVPAPPPAPTLLLPSDGATNQATSLRLSWNASSGATQYQLQVSKVASFATTFLDDATLTSTSYQLGGLENGTAYYWRVRAQNTGGQSAFSSTWSFTTIAATPGIPTLSSPTNGATNQPTSLSVSWNAVASAESYRLQVSTSPDFSTTVVNQAGITTTTYAVSGLSNSTTYYWRVNALNPGGTSNWSATWNFTTVIPPPPAPALSSPGDGAAGIPTNPVMNWDQSSSATSYRFQLSTESGFTSFIVNQNGIASTSYSLSGLSSSATYYWRISAQNAGGASPWSSVWRFTTAPVVPPPPTLTSPPDNAADQLVTPTFVWTTAPRAESYRLQISTNPSFVATVYDDPTPTSTSKQVGPLAYNTTYHWRVSATNAGGTSAWSNTWQFATAPSAPGSPSPSSPSNGMANQPTAVTLSWSASTGAASYALQVSTSSSFSSLVVDEPSLTETSKQVGPLSYNTTYYWRVRAANSGGQSGWSPVWNFTTEPPSQSGPTLTSPPNGAIDQPTTLTLRWGEEALANSYHLQVSTSSTFTTFVFNDSRVTSTSQQIGPLTNGITYYWRVRTNYLLSTSDWSNVWSFSTIPLAPSTPSLLSPPNASTNQPTVVTLNWSPVTEAKSYRLQVSTSPTFASTVVDDATITTASNQVSSLLYNTMYYWRVQSINGGATSSWSVAWNFRTGEKTMAMPSLLAPSNNATDQPTTITLQWDSVTDASTYRLQVATSSAFTSPTFNDSTLTSTSYQVGSLSYGATYYWRVRAKGSGTTSSWSEVWRFNTTQGAMAIPSLLAPANNAQNLSTMLLVRWDTVPDASACHLQVSADSTFTSFVVNDTSLTVTSHQVGPLLRNTTYYWRVRAKFSGAWSPYSSVWKFTTISSSAMVSLSATIAFPSHANASDFQPTDYRLVGIPGASDAALQSLLPGTPEKDWTAVWDNGKTENYFVRHDGSTTFTYTVGRGFWIIKKGPWTISTTVPAAALNASQEAEIPLQAGWNIIANPFASPIDWAGIQSLNKVSEPIHGYNGSFAPSSSFKPYEGYYFFNATNLLYLRVPYAEAPSGKIITTSATRNTDLSGWNVNVKLSSQSSADEALWFGTSTNAAAGKDDLDFHKPRSLSSSLATYFFRPEWDKQYSAFASDLRPEIKECEIWQFTVDATPFEELNMSFAGIEQIPPHLEVVLVDNVRSNSTNLRTNADYAFVPVRRSTPFSVLVGTKNAVEEHLKTIAPLRASFALGENYPNPFNPATVIPVEIPVKAEVTLTVYSLLGQRITTLYEGTLDAGRHWFRWDATDQTGRVVSSGIYLYRLTSKTGFSSVRKMILIR